MYELRRKIESLTTYCINNGHGCASAILNCVANAIESDRLQDFAAYCCAFRFQAKVPVNVDTLRAEHGEPERVS